MHDTRLDVIRGLMTSPPDDEMPFFYREENPYQNIGRDEENNTHQVLGNELIYISSGEGYCCLCGALARVLYADNSFRTNIAVQLCMPCIQACMADDNDDDDDLRTIDEEEEKDSAEEF